MKVTLYAGLIVVGLLFSSPVIAQTQSTISQNRPLTSSVQTQKGGKQGIQPKSHLNPVFRDPRIIAELRANMKTAHHALTETADSKKEMESYSLIKDADDLLKTAHSNQAVAIYRKVLEENGNNMVTAGAIAGLAEVALRSGDKKTAMSFYRQLVYGQQGQTWTTSRSNAPVVRLKFALLLRDAGQEEEAWEHFRYAMDITRTRRVYQLPTLTRNDVVTSQFPLVVNLMIAEQLQNFDANQAISFARDAVRANPTSGLPHYLLAELLYKVDEVEAKAEFEKAVKYGRGEYTKTADNYLNYWKTTGGPKPKKSVPPIPEVAPESLPNN